MSWPRVRGRLAQCGVELEPLLPQLRRDMQHWEPQSITPAMLDKMRAEKDDNVVRVSLMIVNRTVWYLKPLDRQRSPMVIALIHDLQELADQHAVPDVEFVLNVDDYPFVRMNTESELEPPLPLFSHYQTRSHADIMCPGGSFREGGYDEKMLARGRRYYEDRWPWRGKLVRGFWQGHPYCGRHRFGRCSRYLLPHLSAQNASVLLDVGLTFYETKLDNYLSMQRCSCDVGWARRGDLPRHAAPLARRPWVDIEHHPRYRFLLQLDGHSSSWRLQFLLATNSAVLKQDSFYWEYYYTALTPHEHFVPFWTASPLDILHVLPNVSRLQQSAHMRRVARRGQAFAHAHLNAHARQCYWRALLALYARRQQQPPSLVRWPGARRARNNRAEGWHGEHGRGKARLDWSRVSEEWRRGDDASLRHAVRQVEAALRAQRRKLHPRRFVTNVERRSPPMG